MRERSAGGTLYVDKGYRTYSELGIVFDRVLVILLDVVREVVDGDTVVLDILHDLNDERDNGLIDLPHRTKAHEHRRDSPSF